MAIHIFRRGVVYYWRRRVSHKLVICLDRPHVLLSLRTTSHPAARH
ncbi:DUF6538 domain-containing protein [Bradyrhizobium canariense]